MTSFYFWWDFLRHTFWKVQTRWQEGGFCAAFFSFCFEVLIWFFWSFDTGVEYEEHSGKTFAKLGTQIINCHFILLIFHLKLQNCHLKLRNFHWKLALYHAKVSAELKTGLVLLSQLIRNWQDSPSSAAFRDGQTDVS